MWGLTPFVIKPWFVGFPHFDSWEYDLKFVSLCGFVLAILWLLYLGGSAPHSARETLHYVRHLARKSQMHRAGKTNEKRSHSASLPALPKLFIY